MDTSTPICKISFIDGIWRRDDDWQSDRNLAKGLLGNIDKLLGAHNKIWSDITAIGIFEGSGSFTGLRIGLTVGNTMADAMGIPIVGGRGDNWQDEVLGKLRLGKNEKIVLPYYGKGANITAPRK